MAYPSVIVRSASVPPTSMKASIISTSRSKRSSTKVAAAPRLGSAVRMSLKSWNNSNPLSNEGYWRRSPIAARPIGELLRQLRDCGRVGPLDLRPGSGWSSRRGPPPGALRVAEHAEISASGEIDERAGMANLDT